MSLGPIEVKPLFSILISVAIVSFLIYVSGYLYEGLKNNNWSVGDNNFDNLAKSFGGIAFITILILSTIILMAIEVSELL